MAQFNIETDRFTTVKPLGYQASDCGYCKDNLGASYYLTTNYLLPRHYQALMDRGWRRSGNLMYLPDLARSCCPHYTIRLPAARFKPSRDQRQALHRWNKFVLGDHYLAQLDRKYPLSKDEKKATANVFDLRETLHKSEAQFTKPDIRTAHRFEVTLEEDKFTEEKYVLYHHYQRVIHKERPGEISRSGFRRFLCDSPLQRQKTSTDQLLGSYHHCYRLDGRLIAIGVLDLLPHAISGVYFIYHNDFEKFSIGKLSAIREAALADENGYGYYYMGYYIHDCDKMKYKASYQPQYVLDVRSHTWDPFDEEMRSLMSRKRFVSMSVERQRSQRLGRIDTGKILRDSTERIPSAGDHGSISSELSICTNDAEDTEEWDLLDPVEATSSQRSLLKLGMPGVMSMEEVEAEIDLEATRAMIAPGMVFDLSASGSWDSDSAEDPQCLKGLVAELAGCVGPDVFEGLLLDFSR